MAVQNCSGVGTANSNGLFLSERSQNRSANPAESYKTSIVGGPSAHIFEATFIVGLHADRAIEYYEIGIIDVLTQPIRCHKSVHLFWFNHDYVALLDLRMIHVISAILGHLFDNRVHRSTNLTIRLIAVFEQFSDNLEINFLRF